MKKRADILLVVNGLARSRHQAQELIEKGYVRIRIGNEFRPIHKSSEEILADSILLVHENDLSNYVSRGALKLKGALRLFGIDPEGLTALDIGQSTGGFSQVLLEGQAKIVVGIDVGSDQLHSSLRRHPNLYAFEKLHVKDLASREDFLELVPPGGFDLLVMDVSFTSVLKTLLPTLPFLRPNANLLCLVKPQFEVGAENLNRKGVVKDSKIVVSLLRELRHKLESEFDLNVCDIQASDLEGRDGNQEHFMHARKK